MEREVYYVTLIENVKYYIEKFGIKKGYIAKCVGMHQCNFSDWLNGKKEISPYYVSQIEKFVSKAKAVEEFLNSNR